MALKSMLRGVLLKVPQVNVNYLVRKDFKTTLQQNAKGNIYNLFCSTY